MTTPSRYKLFASWFCTILSPALLHGQPGNDDCVNAIRLTNLQNWCSAPGAYTSTGATNPGALAPGSCWSGNGSTDVWFVFTAAATDIWITVNGSSAGGGTLTRPEIALYTTADCNNFNFLPCGTSAQPVDTAGLYKGGLVIGNDYYVRVDGINTSGTFQLCLNNYNVGVTSGQDCGVANYLCSKDPFSVTNVLGAGNDNLEAANTCFVDPESNTVWYYWKAEAGGTLTFDLTPTNNTDDWDWVLFELPNGSCVNRKAIRCNYASCLGPNGSTGMNMTSADTVEFFNCPFPQDAFVKYINMVPGRVYGLLLNNWTSSNSGFTLSFGGTGTFLSPEVTAGNDTTICAGTSVQLNTTVKDTVSGLTYSWTPAGGLSCTACPDPVALPTATTTYEVSITDNSGCSHSDFVKVTVVPCNFTVSVNGTDLCTGDCADISAVPAGGTAPYTYAWNPSPGGTGAGPYNVCPTATTTYQVTVTDVNGGAATGSGTVAVNSPPVPTISSTDAKCGACDGSVSAAATGNAPFLYFWSNGCTSAACGSLCAGTYTVTVTDATGCTAADSVVVGSSQPPVAQVSGAGVCLGTATNFTYGSAGNIASCWWDFGDGQTASACGNQSHTYADTGTYTVIHIVADANGCSDTVSVTVSVYPLPDVCFTQAASGCVPLTASFSTCMAGGGTCLWDLGDGTTSAQCDVSHVYTLPGCYDVSLTVTSPGGCTATRTDSCFAEAYPMPVADFDIYPSDITILDPQVNFTDKSSDAAGWFWRFGDGDTSTERHPVHFYADTGCYLVTLSLANQYGCNDTVSRPLCIRDIFTLYIPNAFTPNGNGKNEWFTIKHYGICEMDLYIFDRWGNEIYHTAGFAGWDGTANSGSEIVQEDTYVWLLRAADCYGKEHERAGHVTVIR